jgi:hypothetical protein
MWYCIPVVLVLSRPHSDSVKVAYRQAGPGSGNSKPRRASAVQSSGVLCLYAPTAECLQFVYLKRLHRFGSLRKAELAGPLPFMVE